MKEEQKALLVTTVVGTVVWAALLGLFHAYIVSVDWDVMSQGGDLSLLLHWRPFISLVECGVLLGFLAESVKLAGGVTRSVAVQVFGPMVMGVLVGLSQGMLVGTEWWGFVPQGIPLRSETIRVVVGGICGFVAIPPSITLSIWFRRGTQYMVKPRH